MTPARALVHLIGRLSRRRILQLCVAVAMMVVTALLEVAAIGAVVPFLNFLLTPTRALKNPALAPLTEVFGTADIGWTLTLVFVAAVVGSGVARISLVVALAKLTSVIGHEMCVEAFRLTLYQPYEVHITRNTADVVAGIRKVDYVVGVLVAVLNGASSLIMAIFVLVALLYIDAPISAAIIFGVGGLYALVALLSRRKLAINSLALTVAYRARVKCVHEALGGIRDVILGQSQPIFVAQFDQTDRDCRDADASNSVIAPIPRFGVEALGMILLAGFGYYLAKGGGNLADKLPILAALTLGLQRLMPMVQQVFQAVVSVRGNAQAISDVLDLLAQPESFPSPTGDGITFRKEVSVQGLCFKYQPSRNLVLSDVNLTIWRGMRVGIIGETGSGKSTFVDLLMGLLEPTSGEILVDGRALTAEARTAWQHNIAHVPQSVFLSDASLLENIAFGLPSNQIVIERVYAASKQAQLADFISRLPEKYHTQVGERGVQLSGGQRQRIAIARALYTGASVLIFDEATSALDETTEEAVLEAIESLGRELTIIIIAHRFETLRGCDAVFRVEEGTVREISSIERGRQGVTPSAAGSERTLENVGRP